METTGGEWYIKADENTLQIVSMSVVDLAPLRERMLMIGAEKTRVGQEPDFYETPNTNKFMTLDALKAEEEQIMTTLALAGSDGNG